MDRKVIIEQARYLIRQDNGEDFDWGVVALAGNLLGISEWDTAGVDALKEEIRGF